MPKIQEARISQFSFKFEGAIFVANGFSNYSKWKIEFYQDGIVMKHVNELERTRRINN